MVSLERIFATVDTLYSNIYQVLNELKERLREEFPDIKREPQLKLSLTKDDIHLAIDIDYIQNVLSYYLSRYSRTSEKWPFEFVVDYVDVWYSDKDEDAYVTAETIYDFIMMIGISHREKPIEFAYDTLADDICHLIDDPVDESSALSVGREIADYLEPLKNNIIDKIAVLLEDAEMRIQDSFQNDEGGISK